MRDENKKRIAVLTGGGNCSGINAVIRAVVNKATYEIENLKKLGVTYLVCIGGDGTLGIAYKLFKDGVPIVGVPKTIDNDLLGTDITFGFDSAVWIATEGIDFSELSNII